MTTLLLRLQSRSPAGRALPRTFCPKSCKKSHGLPLGPAFLRVPFGIDQLRRANSPRSF